MNKKKSILRHIAVKPQNIRDRKELKAPAEKGRSPREQHGDHHRTF
jgi:hypothetical protein